MKPFSCVESAFAWLNSIGCSYNPVSFLSAETVDGVWRGYDYPQRVTVDGAWYDASHRYDAYLNRHSVL